ncbi:hypothetical protein D9C73_020185 [Collichthys lucidus]|uniref:Uncharacterized protein n=1 Tax=Collichthys lucidus TaxID=240159 RepID=A0A4U5VBD2_COLLU|nr:hypothetical protein D9C73_020185 [Collichthys lucidus]
MQTRRIKWNRWAMWWQAAQHTMTEQPKKTQTKDPTPVPPPYCPASPTAPPSALTAPAGMYPRNETDKRKKPSNGLKPRSKNYFRRCQAASQAGGKDKNRTNFP